MPLMYYLISLALLGMCVKSSGAFDFVLESLVRQMNSFNIRRLYLFHLQKNHYTTVKKTQNAQRLNKLTWKVDKHKIHDKLNEQS
jgi:hypothetical protein